MPIRWPYTCIYKHEHGWIFSQEQLIRSLFDCVVVAGFPDQSDNEEEFDRGSRNKRNQRQYWEKKVGSLCIYLIISTAFSFLSVLCTIDNSIA